MTGYLYVGKTDLGYVWLLGRRIYVRRSWRRGDVHYLGTLGDLVGVVVRVKSLLGMRHVYDALVYVKRALLRCLSLAKSCGPSPRRIVQPWEVSWAVEEALWALSRGFPERDGLFDGL